MNNLAGMCEGEVTEICAEELAAAGIPAWMLSENMLGIMTKDREVKSGAIGLVGPWEFRRAWYYWVAKGPGLSLKYATPLHERIGKEVRVGGHCGCPSPEEYEHGFGIGTYHVDTADGLKVLADTLKQVMHDVGLSCTVDPLTSEIQYIPFQAEAIT